MEKIGISINDDVLDVVKKIRAFTGSEVVLDIPDNSVLFENSLNLKLIKKEAEKSGKGVSFETTDEVGKNLIEMLDPLEKSMLDEETGFMTQSKDLLSPQTRVRKFKLPKMAMPRLPSGKKKPVVLGVGLLLATLVTYFVFWHLPKAKVSLIISSSPLVKSVTVNLSSEASSIDASQRTLPGKVATSSFSASASADTTGTKTVGEKAKGEVEVVNKTDSEKTFDKGTVIKLVTSGESLRFVFDEEVTVPAKTETPSADPTEPPIVTYGKATVDVTAEDIGSKYNVDGDENFEIEDFDTDDFIASNDDGFEGGSSKTVKTVAQKDLTDLSNALFESSKAQGLTDLKSTVGGQRLLDSSVTYTKTKEEFDKKVDDEADKVGLNLTIGVSGLTYDNSELNKLLDELLTEFVPEGFELSGKDSNIEVEVLNAPTTGVQVKTLELQVKIKAFVVPKIDEAEILKNLKGAKIDDVKQYLSDIKNVESYKIDLWPKFSFILKRFPSREDKIELVVERK